MSELFSIPGVLAAVMQIAIVLQAATAADVEPLKPRGLRKGDTIQLVAPAGEVEQASVARIRRHLEGRGFRVRVPDLTDRRRGYLAGTDKQRADELMAALGDPAVAGVFPITGGYGITRILDRLDYDAIAAAPKVVIGFSDITGLHLALTRKCNWITFHSPNPDYGWGRPDGLPEYHSRYLWRSLLAEKNIGTARIEYVPPPDARPMATLRSGTARGRLTGGNLSLIAALMGTPYEIETRGRILLLEDIRESPYRIDRMLSQLRLAGKLEAPAAVLLGAFYRCEADRGEPSLTLDEVFDDYFATVPYPVVKYFPAGHGPVNATFPLNALAEVDAEASPPGVRLLETPVLP